MTRLKIFYILFICILSLCFIKIQTQDKNKIIIDSKTANVFRRANSLIGYWLIKDKTAVVEFFNVNDTFKGKVVWLKTPLHDNQPRKDKLNPNPALRDSLILGSINCNNFVFNKKQDQWEGGYIYDNRTGRYFEAYLKLSQNNNDILKLRGFSINGEIPKRLSTWIRLSEQQVYSLHLYSTQ